MLFGNRYSNIFMFSSKIFINLISVSYLTTLIRISNKMLKLGGYSYPMGILVLFLISRHKICILYRLVWVP